MKKYKVLIAEDDFSQLNILEHDFREQGYEVYTFVDGADVLPVVESIMPDLIVLDINLPHVDGWEIARKLNTNYETKHIPVVIASGIDMEEGKVHALLHGCIDFLEKPINTDCLLKRAEEYIHFGRVRKRSLELYAKSHK